MERFEVKVNNFSTRVFMRVTGAQREALAKALRRDEPGLLNMSARNGSSSALDIIRRGDDGKFLIDVSKIDTEGVVHEEPFIIRRLDSSDRI